MICIRNAYAKIALIDFFCWLLDTPGVRTILAARFAPVAQLDRASDYESEGWGFESLQACVYHQ